MRFQRAVLAGLFFSNFYQLHGQELMQPQTTDRMNLHRFEAGVQTGLVGFEPCLSSASCTKAPPRLFFGPSLSVNLSRGLAVDANYAVAFANDDHPSSYDDGSVAGGRASEFMIGPRITTRTGKWGAFVGAELGFFRWSAARTGFSYNVSPITGLYVPTPVYGPAMFFTGKAKAGLEYALSNRLRARLEVGDQFIDYGQSQFAGVTVRSPEPDAWNSSATVKGSVVYGAGPAMRESSGTGSRGEHRFFDKTNLLLLSASLLGQTADAVTTQRFESRGGVEGNYLARGLVDEGWPGQIALGVVYNGLQLGLMYGMHKLGHYRLERVLPIATAAAGATAAYSNTR